MEQKIRQHKFTCDRCGADFDSFMDGESLLRSWARENNK